MLEPPSGGAGTGAATADSRLMSIGTVLSLLRDEFPEVTISKIRFLESEGLVEPRRTPSGYRKFSAGDVERLARVLRMQRDGYLPLKVIRERLDVLEGVRPGQDAVGGEPGPTGESEDGFSGPAGADDPAQDLVPESEADGATAVRVGRDELLAAAGSGEEQLEAWEAFGLIEPLPEGGYDAAAVTVATLLGEMARFGIEPRHLRAMKTAADRDAGLVDQVVAPLKRHPNPDTREHARVRTRELAGLTTRLHSALLQTALGVRLS
ncbi:transcriptional regulator FtsR [Streptomyces abyssomicinicus]|uniref:transcriptional regulator FtsR n=1 Tax=Streptomyces abyssomicinicus TaxID=574929 RepID=UPI00124FA5F0|nr:MerR family transcriptional regulator [Streptomyces abyssomicinicus]